MAGETSVEPRKTKAKRRLSEGAQQFRRTVVQSLTTAFGLVIALVWNNVVQGGFAVLGVGLTVGQTNPWGWFYYALSAAAITVVSVVMIVLLSRWAGKKQVD